MVRGIVTAGRPSRIAPSAPESSYGSGIVRCAIGVGEGAGCARGLAGDRSCRMSRIEEPARSVAFFIADVDSLLGDDVQLHCCGGFVVTQPSGVARTTSDINFLSAVPYLLGRLN